MNAAGSNAPAHCPNREVLRAFVLGDLAPDTLQAIAAHVNTCGRCASSLDEVEPLEDELLAILRGCGSRNANASLAVADVRAVQGTATWPNAHADAATVSLLSGVGGNQPALKLPEAIGRYRVRRLLGGGGMGIVYEAADPELQRTVAVKVLRYGAYATPELLRRFATEGQAAARLDHPNIVRVLDCGTFEGEPYLALEYVAGGSLADRVSRGPLPQREAAELVLRLATALQYAHDQGVLHRDLKPSNVLLDESGRPKIADFGLARLLDNDTRITLTNDMLGTPAYMSPEQAAGRVKEIGPTSDVYGLGAILYECLTGKATFIGSKEEVVRQAIHDEPAAPSSITHGISPVLDAICLKCLEKKPSARYASAGDLADDLSRLLRGDATNAKPRRWVERRWRAIRRRPVAFAASLMLIFAAAATPEVVDSLDPNREIKAIERQLDLRENVTLVSETGGPRWSRWAVQGDANPAPVIPGREFSIQTWDLALLELLRDPRQTTFRITAEVKHLDSENQGEVGVFVARTQAAADPAPLQQFVYFSFNDIRAPQQVRGLPPRVANAVKLVPQFIVPAVDHPVWSAQASTLQVKDDWCMPAGRNNTNWRRLIVEVSPEAIKGRWQGAENEPLVIPLGELEANTDSLVKKVQRNYPDNPYASLIQPKFAVRGGVGLYVYGGSAAFRLVTIQFPNGG